ncbi:MAG: hypothetical protein IKW00_08890 [Clostridia bacterium]|nr:hypothetical protein [Clostridia bacterium]
MATKSLGTTLTFNGTPVGTLSSISEISCDSELIDVTTLQSENGCKEFIQGAKDAGEIKLGGFHVKDEAGQNALRDAYTSGESGTVIITFPDGMTVTFPALVKSHALGAAQVDGAIAFSCVLRAVGQVVFA